MGNCQQQDYLTGILELEVRYSTKGDFGLFDYEDQMKLVTNKIAISEKGGLLMKTHTNSIIFQSNDEKTPEFFKPMLKLDYNRQSKNFSLEKINENLAKDGFWLVVKDYNLNKGYSLEIGDHIKLGRSVFKLLEFQKLASREPNLLYKVKKPIMSEPFLSLDEQFTSRTMSPRVHYSTELTLEQPIFCRICLEENTSEYNENPLVSPCNCIGSVKFVHWLCLFKWMTGKLQQNENCLTLLKKNFKCELCKRRIGYIFSLFFDGFNQISPGKLTHKGKVFDFVETAKRQFQIFAIFEIFSSKSFKSKGLHILNFSNKSSFKLGRGKECDFQLSDISISRVHAQIDFNRSNNKLIIRDNFSKFGTLVLLTKKLDISNKSTTTLQLGGLCFRFMNSPSAGIMNFCYDSKRNRKFNEEEMETEIRLMTGRDEWVIEENHNVFMEENS